MNSRPRRPVLDTRQVSQTIFLPRLPHLAQTAGVIRYHQHGVTQRFRPADLGGGRRKIADPLNATLRPSSPEAPNKSVGGRSDRLLARALTR